jgi:photosystem II stability/assembly factor-like uncharacterized protein
LIGLFPIAVDLGESRGPAHLLLDGRPVCEVSERSPGCTVDLGPAPRVHRLELVRSDAAGHVTERVSRWINRPGIEPEVLVAGACEPKRGTCEFDLAWAHPRKLDPKRLSLQLDGVARWDRVAHHASLPFAKNAPPQVVVCDVEFPDGTRATYTRTLFAFYPEQAQASLSAVPIVPEETGAPADHLAASLGAAGFPVRAVEETEPEVTFVMDWWALDGAMGEPVPQNAIPRLPRWPADSSKDFQTVHVVFPTESLPAKDIPLARLGGVRPRARPRFSRYADAVAAAGYSLGAAPRRRAVVLILSEFDRPDISSFSVAQALAYLDEVMVPLVVWRVGAVEAPWWPNGPRLSGKQGVIAALHDLRYEIDRQRIAWIEGSRDTRYLGRWLTPGIALAGRVSPPGDTDVFAEAAAGSAAQARVGSAGPDGGPVHALVFAEDGSIAYAGTHGGVFRSRSGGNSWEAASAGLPIAPVRCLVVDASAPQSIAAGTDAGLFLSADAGTHWQAGFGELASVPIASMARDSSNPRILYAGSAGRGVLRSDDGGRTLLKAGLDHGDFRAVAVDPADHTVFAASESGVYRSRDRGLTWSAVASLPSRVMAMAIDGTAGGRIFAATDGEGLFVSVDSGGSWSRTRLARTFLTSLQAAAGGGKRLVAGSPDGVYASEDGGETWKLARVGPAEAVAVESGALLAGTARGILRRSGADPAWKDASAGLAAQVVYAVAVVPGPPDTLYAATSTGLLRAGAGGAKWSVVPGIPDDVAAYAVAPHGSASSEVYVGTSGSIGRSADHGQSWIFSPTLAAFHIVVNPLVADTALAATREGVLRSQDGGAHWDPAVSGLEKTFALQLGGDPSDPRNVYAATAGSGVFRTANAARTWQPGGVELLRRIVRCVAVEPGDGAALFAGTDSGVFRSADRGESWEPSSDGLPPTTVYALVADVAAPGTVYAGTARGLYRSTDRGASWNVFPAEGIRASVTSLWLDPARGALVAGSLGAGVLVIPLRRLN